MPSEASALHLNPGHPLAEAFEKWWEEHGQYGRSGGGEYEKTFAFNAWCAAPHAFQESIGRWEEACFGLEDTHGLSFAGDQVIEGALKMLHAQGYDPSRLSLLQRKVWSGPPGQVSSEMGGLMVSLATYARACRLDLMEEAGAELERIRSRKTES